MPGVAPANRETVPEGFTEVVLMERGIQNQLLYTSSHFWTVLYPESSHSRNSSRLWVPRKSAIPLTEQPIRRLRNITRLVSGQWVIRSVTVLAYKYANFSVLKYSSKLLWRAGNVSTRQHNSYDSNDCSRQGLPPFTRRSFQLGPSSIRPNFCIFSSHARPGSPFTRRRSATFV